MSERLDRIERNIENLTNDIQNLTNEVRTLAEISARHDQQIQANSRHIEALAQSFVENIEVIRLMRTDIQGLRLETQRVINHLFGENQQ
jgi:predicted  nucleic acid-binding Zn-ribbon protein